MFDGIESYENIIEVIIKTINEGIITYEDAILGLSEELKEELDRRIK